MLGKRRWGTSVFVKKILLYLLSNYYIDIEVYLYIVVVINIAPINLIYAHAS